jgi:hypothetical protein
MKTISLSIFISLTVISVHAHESYRDRYPLPITGNSDRDRAITYGGVGAAVGAIIGNQMDGDRSEKRAIGASVGAMTGAILAEREKNVDAIYWWVERSLTPKSCVKSMR